MKKPVIKLRDEIARLQEQLKQAETKEAGRIGRIALRAGLGDVEVEDSDLIKAFEELSARFRKTPATKASAPGASQGNTRTD